MNYMHKFAHLRTDKSPARWTVQTRFRAPHKPLLLLSVIDLIEQSVIRENLIKLEEAPEDTQQYQAESRSAAFRRVVVQAYDHRCALCGV